MNVHLITDGRFYPGETGSGLFFPIGVEQLGENGIFFMRTRWSCSHNGQRISDKVVATADMSDPSFPTRGNWTDDRNYLGGRKIVNERASWDLRHSITGHSDKTDPSVSKLGAEFANDLHNAVKTELDAALAKGGPGAAYGLLGGEFQAKITLPKYESWNDHKKHLPRQVWRMGMSITHGG